MKNNQEFKKPLIFDIDISPFQQYPMTYKGVVSQQKDTLPKENCMNKKFIAFTLVLLIAMGGLFAVERNVNPTALLKATISPEFTHGFTNGTLAYQTGVEVFNAFSDNTPTLIYGFEAKADAMFKSMMTLTAFEHQTTGSTATVGISKVLLNGDEATAVSGAYEILSYTSEEVGKKKIKSVNIQVIPVATDVTNALPGDYISTITVEIVS